MGETVERPKFTAEDYQDATSLDIEATYHLLSAISAYARADHMRYALSLPNLKRLTGDAPGQIAEPIAVVGLGPSLDDTWEQTRDFKYVLTMSGSHRYLLDRGIVPTYHLDIDPRSYKYELLGPPHPGIQYFISSHSHPFMFGHLKDSDVTLIHPQSAKYDLARLVPRGEWAFRGGPSVGHKAMMLARYLGFSDIHIFGLDGCVRGTPENFISHAVPHPNPIVHPLPTEYDGTMYLTAPNLLTYSQHFIKLLDRLPDAKFTFYGHGLLQHMARNRVPNPDAIMVVALRKDELVSPEYREQLVELNWQRKANALRIPRIKDLHRERLVNLTTEMANSLGARSVLDYGCGNGELANDLLFPIWEYDPSIPGKDVDPKPADLVVCFDVLEHIEPEKLDLVLLHLNLCTRGVLYAEIANYPAVKNLPDGRNAHLIVQPAEWWIEKMAPYFTVAKHFQTPVDRKPTFCAAWVRTHPFPEDLA